MLVRNMKTLCLYYTRTNHTKEVMENISKIIDADLVEYSDGKDRKGALGYVGACFVTTKKSLPYVFIKDDIDMSKYDRVIIGMPIWVEGPCAIGKAFIKKYEKCFPKEVYYVVTHMGANSYMKKIEGLDALLGRASSGAASIKTKNNDYLKESTDFALSLNTNK